MIDDRHFYKKLMFVLMIASGILKGQPTILNISVFRNKIILFSSLL